MSELAIVITAYNRARPLKNLLDSLNSIVTTKRLPLIISIDNKGTEEVNEVANAFAWKHGEKQVIIHQEKKGLRAHFIWAGDQTEHYENVLFLEDDLYVSPYILEFVEAAIEKYRDDPRITGVSLYNPLICEFDNCRFYQVEDGFDNYFFQHPYWGNVWFRDSWCEFKEWLSTYKYNPSVLPLKVQIWNETSFKKIYIQYLAEKDRYMVYPRVSYVTNMGETGLHNKTNLRQFHTSLQYGVTNLHLSGFHQSSSVYDVFCEYSSEILKKKNKQLSIYDFEMDIRGLKTNYKKEYVLTSKPVKSFDLSFSNDFRPQEINTILGIKGNALFLTRTENVINEGDFKRKRIVEDILCANYKIGLHEVIDCFFYLIRRRFF